MPRSLSSTTTTRPNFPSYSVPNLSGQEQNSPSTSTAFTSGPQLNARSHQGTRLFPPTTSELSSSQRNQALESNYSGSSFQLLVSTQIPPQCTVLPGISNSASSSHCNLNSNVNDGLRNLFQPSFRRNVFKPKLSMTRNKRSKFKSDQFKGCSGSSNPTFRMPVILLLGPSTVTVPEGKKKKVLHENKFIRDSMEFQKSWTEMDVLREIRRAFRDQIDDGIKIELLNSCGGALVYADVEGDELNASLIHRIWRQKPLYARPSVELLPSDSSEDTQSEYVQDISSDEDSLPLINILPTHKKRRNSSHDQNHSATVPSVDYTLDQTPTISPITEASSEIIGIPNFYLSKSSSGDGLLLSASNQTQNQCNSETSQYAKFWGLFNDETLEAYAIDDYADASELNEIIEESEPNNIPSDDVSNTEIVKATADINRKKFMECTLRAFKRKGYDPTFKVSVCFTDCLNDRGTSTIDAGGPTREFLRLLVKEMVNSHVFTGPNEARILSQNTAAQAQNMYFYAGQAFAVSLVHGGSGPQSLSKLTYKSLVKDVKDLEPSLDDVGDYEIKGKLKAIMDSEDLESLQDAASNISDLRYLAGCTKPILKMEDKERVLKALLHFCVFTTTVEARQCFINGLKTLGLHEAMSKHIDAFEPLFCYQKNDLSAFEFVNLFSIVNYTDEPLSKFTLEMDVMAYFRDYIFECEAGATKSTVKEWLIFSTGADAIPPLGFNATPSIGFLHPSDNTPEAKKKASSVPMASTCALRLDLPVIHESYETFCESMDEAVKSSFSFGIP